MNALIDWVVQFFTTGAIIIVLAYASIPLFHILQGRRLRMRLHRRLALGKLNPNGFEARMESGEIYLASRQWIRAVADLSSALEIVPDHAHCHSLLGQAQYHKGDYQEAVAHLEEALKIRPELGYGHTHVLIGRAFEALEDMEKAETWYRAALERNSSISEPAYRLAFVLRKSGDLEGYRRELGKAIERFSWLDRANRWSNLVYFLLAKLRNFTGT